MQKKQQFGAKIIVDEYEKILETKKYKNFITSACPAVNSLIQQYYPDAIKYLAPVDSPAVAHAKMILSKNKDVKVIFIGPCIAKKKECSESKSTDGVITFEDLKDMLNENEIVFENCKNEEEYINKAKFFPISRGIIKAFSKLPEGYEYVAIDGVEKCKEALQHIDDLSDMFLELNICEGSCINGPCVLNKEGDSVKSNAYIRKYASKGSKEKKINCENINVCINHERILDDSKVGNEEEIQKILAKTGKFEIRDELNCGACGYETCREKAWAVLNGYADIEMCVPYMRERAESMSYEVIRNTPNGIIVIDNEFNIVDINNKAKTILGVRENIKGECIADYLETEKFATCITEEKNVFVKKVCIEKTNIFIELSISYLKEHKMMFAVMKDITDKVNYDSRLKQVKLDTINTADDVIKKHMRVAQEIASLLGETTAETKVALVNLKNTFEEGEN